MAARVDIKREDDRCQLTVSGTIDETFDKRFLAELPKGLPIVINLKAATRINSMGMLMWRNLMRELSAISDAIYIQECSTMMIGQTSTIHGFMGRAIILSVCVPYVCEACGHQKEIVCKSTELQLSAALPCDKCGQGMVLDDAPEIYLQIPATNLPSEPKPTQQLRR